MRKPSRVRAGLLLVGPLVALAGCSPAAHGPIIVKPTPVVSVPAPPAVAPSQLIIPAIGVNSTLVPLGLNPDGTIRVPDLDHVGQAAWYCDHHSEINGVPACGKGVIPGQPGPAVLDGHVDGHKVPGVFYRLKDLSVGDRIEIRRQDGSTLNFRVTATETVPKSQFPSKKVYGDVDHPALRILTCGGSFVGGQLGYNDQVIVYADLVASGDFH